MFLIDEWSCAAVTNTYVSIAVASRAMPVTLVPDEELSSDPQPSLLKALTIFFLQSVTSYMTTAAAGLLHPPPFTSF